MMIEIGPNLTIAIQAVSVVCDVISFVLLLYLWRKSEQLQKENEQLREALRVIGYGPPHEGNPLDLLNQFVDLARATLKGGK